jgi:hypothetical protein
MLPARSFSFSQRSLALTLVLFTGLVFGYFLVRTYSDPLPRQYRLDFTGANWIEPSEYSPIAYFRRKIFLSFPPEQAWLEIAATDYYKLTINGRTIGSGNFLKTRVSGIYDIKGHLTQGTNVIAVEVDRTSFPGSAQLLVRGAIKEPGRESAPLVSDPQWKVATYTGIVQGTEPWDSVLVQDETWPVANLARVPTDEAIDWVNTNPLLLQLPPAGSWILARDGRREAIFATSVDAQKTDQETWIQVASSGNLDLLINDRLVTTVPTAPLKQRLPHLPPATVIPPKNSEQQPSSDVSTAATTATASAIEPLDLEAYDISRWIRPGRNYITAAVRSPYGPAMFLAEGFTIEPGGAVDRFQTSSKWSVVGLTAPDRGAKLEQPIEAGPNGAAPFGYLHEGLLKQPHLTDFDILFKDTAVLLAAILLTAVLWLAASAFITILRKESFPAVLARDALLHLPVLIALLLLLLLSYDYRLPYTLPFQPKFVWGAVAALLLLKLLHYVAPQRLPALLPHPWPQIAASLKRTSPYLLLGLIMLLGFAFRYHDLSFMSFDHDEMGVIQKSEGVFKRGYPYNEYIGIIRPATTYELVGYVLAVSGKLFGYSEWSMRLPSCIWGTLTIAVVGLMGRRLFNWRTGLITALIYACMNLNIRWAQNAFYVQQCQFLALLTIWCFYEAIQVQPFHRKYLVTTSILFGLTFLSWEGSGFLLPAFVIALLVLRPNQWWWLKDWFLYKCLFFVAALVIAQFCWRTVLSNPPYITVGSGLSNLTGPSLFFINYAYQPTYYIEKLLLAENHVPFTLLLIAGLPLCWRQPGFRYVVTLIVMLIFLYTNFLAALSPRYCYFYQPLLLLGAVGAAFTLFDRLMAIARQAGDWPIAQILARSAGCALLVLLFLQSNEWFLKDYTLAGEGNSPGLMTRSDTYRYDYRSAAHYVKTHFQPGDTIVAVVPHVFEYYSQLKGDYFLNSLFNKKVSYTDLYPEPVFIDKFRGYPSLRDVTELLEATHRGQRTWVVLVPWGSLKKMASPDVITYLDQNAKSVFESYRAKIFLIQGTGNVTTTAQSGQP